MSDKQLIRVAVERLLYRISRTHGRDRERAVKLLEPPFCASDDILKSSADEVVSLLFPEVK